MVRTRGSLALGAALLISCSGAVAAQPAHAVNEHWANMVTYYHWGREDNFSAVTANDHYNARRMGYEWIRSKEAWVLVEPTDTNRQKPLILFYNSARGDYVSTATADGIASALSAGYVRKGVQGYIWKDRQPGTVPLHQYWNPKREDNFAAASPEGTASAESADYQWIRVEGYVRPGTAF
ncbi:hypothetical protein [Streptomyces sp. NPDC000618]|uniref:hypothetical protein n=1 Tax=Streptomyces sp. NPDC000618 TaxID=3154265 RepID=UPI003325900B